ncbi:hypothetical protein ACPA9J_09455 [Pseudomonas aeruginosa]
MSRALNDVAAGTLFGVALELQGPARQPPAGVPVARPTRSRQ